MIELHTDLIDDELFENIKKEGIDTLTRNELSIFTLDTLGILLIRATFMHYPELNDLPTMGNDEEGDTLRTRTVLKGFPTKTLFIKSHFERLLRSIAKACIEIKKPVMQGSMKISLALGEYDNELKITLIWVE